MYDNGSVIKQDSLRAHQEKPIHQFTDFKRS
jgi:hypothetical protein